MIELRLLGRIDVLGPDAERVRAVLAQPRRVALLAYLAVHASQGPRRRDQLARLFWPDAEPAAARQSLRQALSFLRRALGERTILTRGEARGEEEVGVDPAEVCSDVALLRALLDAGDLRRAAELYRGELLQGLPSTGIHGFERWLDELRDELRSRVRAALRRLAEEDAEVGDARLAALWARREHELDPADEDSAMHLMRRLAAAGDRPGALAVYDELARLLAQELDDEPSPEVVALAHEIRQAPDPTPGVMPVAVAPSAPAMEGESGADGGGAPEMPTRAPDERSAAPRGAAVQIAHRVSPHRSWRRTARWGGAALVAFVLMVAGATTLRLLGVAPFGTLIASGALRADDAVVVADFTSPGDSALGQAVAQGVKSDLARSRAVRVVSDEAVADALRRMERGDAALTLPVAREVAERVGARAIVDGGIVPLGAGFLLTLRLVTADSGREVVGYRASVDSPGELVGAVGTLTRKLRARIGESLREVEGSPPLADATTASLDALRRYTDGFRALGRHGDRPRFVQMMQEAIALDSTFAAAYMWLAAELDNRGGQAGEVARLIARAYDLRGRLPASDQRWIEYFYFIAGPPAARDSGQALAALHAQHADPANRNPSITLNNLGWAFHERGMRAQAESLYQLAIAADTTYRYPLSNLIQLRAAHGDLAGADSLVPLFRSRFPHGYTGVLVASALLRARGDLDAAEAMAREALAGTSDPYSQAEYAAVIALTAGMEGRVRDFEAATARVAEARRARGIATADLDAALDRASFHALVGGDRARARRILDSATVERADAMDAMDPLDRPHATAAIAYALAGDAPAAQRHLAGVERQIPEGDLGLAYLLRLARATVAIAERQWDDAIHEARLARVGRCTRCGELPLAVAYDAAGARDSAIAVLERTRVGVPMRRYPGTFAELASGPVLRRLGELYEAQGDTARAVDRYARFVALWRRADPELQPQVAEVRARLARLRSRGAPARLETVEGAHEHTDVLRVDRVRRLSRPPVSPL